MSEIKRAIKRAREIAKNHDIKTVARYAKNYFSFRMNHPEAWGKKAPEVGQQAVDILFVANYFNAACEHYLVDNPMEQLRANDVSCSKVNYDKLTLDMVRYARGFVFYRTPITDTIREFIELAKSLNKTCFYSIDDLVINKKYTKQIKFIQQMSEFDRQVYDNGVRLTEENLKLCDYGITTTEQLATELKKYQNFREVFVNRNVESDKAIYRSSVALAKIQRDSSRVVVGYFSGSITHNDDFTMVLPALIKLVKKYPNVYLKLTGILDTPNELRSLEGRLIIGKHVSMEQLPSEMIKCDIALSPLEDTIFNRAKSEVKWEQAALVKVPIVASNIGAFAHEVRNNETGILVENTTKAWYDALEELVKNPEKRKKLGDNAYDEVTKNHTTIYTGYPLANFICRKLKPNVAFLMPTTNVGGGNIVTTKHAEILRKNGYDVSLVNLDSTYGRHESEFDKNLKNCVIVDKIHQLNMSVDHIVATLWSTVDFANTYPRKQEFSYLVQSFETNFYQSPHVFRQNANKTYNNFAPTNYITMSRWCQNWLIDKFGKDSKYASNGINLANYPVRERKFKKNDKIKILIEGDSASEYKKVDESFKIVAELCKRDREKYEITYLSYAAKPKSWYIVDHFYNKIPAEKVGKIFSENDILIKSSILESFSYPPLEMMATGGFAVVAPNDGNAEYAQDEKNLLYYRPEDIKDATKKVQKIINDKILRENLFLGGQKTAKSYEWKNMEKEILKLYE